VRVRRGCSICLFLAGLLDALLAGVEGTLLALGGLHHVLLSLGIYKEDQYTESDVVE
jgi:hypothetical protein